MCFLLEYMSEFISHMVRDDLFPEFCAPNKMLIELAVAMIGHNDRSVTYIDGWINENVPHHRNRAPLLRWWA